MTMIRPKIKGLIMPKPKAKMVIENTMIGAKGKGVRKGEFLGIENKVR